MGLFHIAVFMGYAGIVPGRLHAVMSQERMIAWGKILFPSSAALLHRRSQMIGPMQAGHSANLPQAVLQPFCESLEAFAETQTHGFHIRVREHEMVEQMGKRLACQGDQEVIHMRKIRLTTLARRIPLFKDHFLFWSM